MHERFEDVLAWQRAADLYIAALDLVEAAGPAFSRGFRDQLDRAALSVSNNIAEGFERYSTGEFISFLTYARGSSGEVRSMLTVIRRKVRRPDLIAKVDVVKDLAEDCCRQLGAWSASLRARSAQRRPRKSPRMDDRG